MPHCAAVSGVRLGGDERVRSESGVPYYLLLRGSDSGSRHPCPRRRRVLGDASGHCQSTVGDGGQDGSSRCYSTGWSQLPGPPSRVVPGRLQICVRHGSAILCHRIRDSCLTQMCCMNCTVNYPAVQANCQAAGVLSPRTILPLIPPTIQETLVPRRARPPTPSPCGNSR